MSPDAASPPIRRWTRAALLQALGRGPVASLPAIMAALVDDVTRLSAWLTTLDDQAAAQGFRAAHQTAEYHRTTAQLQKTLTLLGLPLEPPTAGSEHADAGPLQYSDAT